MDQATNPFLELWRGACRHIDVTESISDLAGAIHAIVAIDRMWLFGFEHGACHLLAAHPRGPEAAPGSPPAAPDAIALARFAAKGELSLLQTSDPGRGVLRSLAPILGPGHFVCGGLQRDGQPEGVVAWRLAPGAGANDRTRALLAATLEPLAVAMENSCRFHELEELRRAAEADRHSALRRLGRDSLSEPIIGERTGLRGVMERVNTVAPSGLPALILGETGSGKEVIARAIHDRSPRRDGPFLRVNCGAIPPELIDSQLFGHEQGAFTGATDRRLGWFERAHGGTLFLDEIGELPLAAQVRLLRVLQEGALERVGGQAPVSVDCRIVAATHRDLAEMVRQRTFREDLWYRVAVFPIVLPPLRERREDLAELARHFVDRASLRFGLPPFTLHGEDVERLALYRWPGNIRELAAVIDRAVLLSRGDRLALAAAIGPDTPAPDPPAPTGPARAVATLSTLEDAIRTHIERALHERAGRIEGPDGAAALLRINPHTLRSKMRKLGIDPKAARPGRRGVGALVRTDGAFGA